MSLSKLFTSFRTKFREQSTVARRPLFFSLLPLTACAFALTSTVLSGCVMSEEMKRIDAVKKMQQAREVSGSTNLTGEQLFIRNCNTCHPGGRVGMGPSLENVAKDLPTDAALKAFLRKGKGMMPSQERLTEQEMDNLVGYVRALTFEK